MCSVHASQPNNAAPSYVHNPYLDGGAYGNSVDANRVGTSALTIGLDPTAAAGAAAGQTVSPATQPTTSSATNPTSNLTVK